jgi:hypothetical protein
MRSQLSAPVLHMLATTAEQWHLSSSTALLISLVIGALQAVRLTWINRNRRTPA